MQGMIEDLIAYEIAGQRRCIPAPLGSKQLVGSAEECQIPLSSDQVPEVLFGFVRKEGGIIRMVDEQDRLVHEVEMPFECDLLGMTFVMFEPGELLESPFTVDDSRSRALVLRTGDDGTKTVLDVEPGQLACAGCAADADIVLPGGPNYAYLLWWDGRRRVHLALLDNSEGGAWSTGGDWGHTEGVTLPVSLLAGETVCELSWEPKAEVEGDAAEEGETGGESDAQGGEEGGE